MSLLPNNYVSNYVARSTFMSPAGLKKEAARTRGNVFNKVALTNDAASGGFEMKKRNMMALGQKTNPEASYSEKQAQANSTRSLDDYLNDFMNRFNSLPDDYRSQAAQELRSSYEDSARQGFMDAFKSIPDQYKRDALSAIGGFGY